jgi:hypothetical protein
MSSGESPVVSPRSAVSAAVSIEHSDEEDDDDDGDDDDERKNDTAGDTTTTTTAGTENTGQVGKCETRAP